MLVGVSWDLLWVPFAVAVAFVVMHLLIRRAARQRQARKNPN